MRLLLKFACMIIRAKPLRRKDIEVDLLTAQSVLPFSVEEFVRWTHGLHNQSCLLR